MLTDAIADLEYQTDSPNDRKYASINLGTWSSASDVDTFLSRFNHSTAYKDGNTKLSVGNYVNIRDGSYNALWEIAGFDMESNQKAADGTVYDNGYGICMIPREKLIDGRWTLSDDNIDGGYKSSYMHTTELPNIVTKLQNVLGSHIVTRNVLLSSSVDRNYHSNGYTWTTAKATLMSTGQITGNFAENWNKYDDGEANYKLPIFNSKDLYTNYTIFLRGIWGLDGYLRAWVSSYGGISNYRVATKQGVFPLIYIR